MKNAGIPAVTHLAAMGYSRVNLPERWLPAYNSTDWLIRECLPNLPERWLPAYNSMVVPGEANNPNLPERWLPAYNSPALIRLFARVIYLSVGCRPTTAYLEAGTYEF